VGPDTLSTGTESDESLSSAGGTSALNLAAIAAAALRLLRTRSSKSVETLLAEAALGIDEDGGGGGTD
jgi:hypothetical protein